MALLLFGCADILSPVVLQAQIREPFTESITVPQGRQMAVIQMNSYLGKFEKAVRCKSGVPNGCDAEYLIEVSGPGVSYSETQKGDGQTDPPAGYSEWQTWIQPDYLHPNPADPEHDPARNDVLTVYVRRKTLVFNVSQETRTGPVTLTVSGWLVRPRTVPLSEILRPDHKVYDLRFVVTAPPPDRPRDARDPAAACDTNNGCFYEFGITLEGLVGDEAHDDRDVSLGPVTAQFDLDRPKDPNKPGESLGYLPGTSSNGGTERSASSVGDPDFIFEAEQNPDLAAPMGLLHVETPLGWDWRLGAHVRVTSRDYGGAALLRAKVMVQGVTYDVVDFLQTSPDGGDYVGFNPPACAGTGSFAMLPVDLDCNAIADFWEEQYLGPGKHFDPAADDDAGFDATSPKGDGFAAHDEYRGFHYVENDGKTVRWTDTDPVGKQDVFVWDTVSKGACSSGGFSENCLTEALIGANSILRPNTQSFIAYRRVNAKQANPVKDDKLPKERAAHLAVNSHFYKPEDRARALVFMNSTLRVRCDTNPPEPGAIGNSGGFVTNGTPIQIDFRQVRYCSALKGYPSGVFLAQVAAHEAGHKFNLSHPLRRVVGPSGMLTDLVPNMPVPADLQTIDLGHYSRVDNTPLFYVRLERYDYRSATEVGDHILDYVGNLGGIGNPIKEPIVPLPPNGPNSCMGLPNCLYKVTTTKPMSTLVNTIQIENQLGRIMDWTPRYTLLTLADWIFNPGPPDQRSSIVLKFRN